LAAACSWQYTLSPASETTSPISSLVKPLERRVCLIPNQFAMAALEAAWFASAKSLAQFLAASTSLAFMTHIPLKRAAQPPLVLIMFATAVTA